MLGLHSRYSSCCASPREGTGRGEWRREKSITDQTQGVIARYDRAGSTCHVGAALVRGNILHAYPLYACEQGLAICLFCGASSNHKYTRKTAREKNKIHKYVAYDSEGRTF